MSGFDLPPIGGFDQSFKQALRPFQSPEGFRVPDLQPLDGAQGDRGSAGGASPFSGVLSDSLNAVRELREESKNMARGLMMGEDVELHDVLIAGDKSEAAFNLMLEVRNKFIDAWEKLSRSSV